MTTSELIGTLENTIKTLKTYPPSTPVVTTFYDLDGYSEVHEDMNIRLDTEHQDSPEDYLVFLTICYHLN